MAVQPARLPAADPRALRAAPSLRVTRAVRDTTAVRAPGVPRRLVAPGGLAMPHAQQVELHWPAVELRIPRRSRSAAVSLLLIAVCTLAGLAYLDQRLAADSLRYRADTLLVQRNELLRTLQSQQATIARWGSEAQVVQWAQRQGLDRLGTAVHVKAR